MLPGFSVTEVDALAVKGLGTPSTGGLVGFESGAGNAEGGSSEAARIQYFLSLNACQFLYRPCSNTCTVTLLAQPAYRKV